MDEEEKIYSLMMEALDGELADAGHSELEAHLRLRPDMAREWKMLQAVDALLRQAPVISPASGFASRTLAMLPRSRTRLRTLAWMYALLLLSGILPVVAVSWFSARIGPSLPLSAFAGGLVQGAEAFGSLALRTFAAFGQMLGALGEQASQRPGVWGWLFVMVGLIVLWRGVYQVLMRVPSPSMTTDR